MGLREQAAADLRTILEDEDGGFGWPITVTAPDGTSAAVTGFSSDVGQSIDPDTGIAVIGRRASVVIALASLIAAGLGTPKGVADAGGRPWVVAFDDIQGTSHTFKVAEAMPDQAIGMVSCLLEAYRP